MEATRKTRKAGNWRTAFQYRIEPAWLSTMSRMRKDPATMISVTKLSPSASSYENICAEERRPPISVYLLLAAQPAITMPYTPSEETAKRNRMPTSRSEIWSRMGRPPMFTVPP